MAVTAAEVSKLRKLTGAGMMDCKNALEEANGDYDKAIEIIRKKGQLVASKRADREAGEGVVLAKSTADEKRGAIIVLNCETDFVAKNENFINFAQSILNLALESNPADLDALKQLIMEGRTIGEQVTEQVGIIGEKIDLSYYDKIEAAQVIPYIHPGNKLATLVGLNKKADLQVGKDVAMQVAAMNPVAVDKDAVPADVIAKEKEIAMDQTKNDPRNQNKPANILDKIAEGKLEKFFREGTLLNQQFTKDNSKTIRQYLQSVDNDLMVTGFLRFSLK
ncbi:MAG: elongation factor Ts [Bacteroidales bacterium]|nr:elongation factor Ts [Bacteroidales bacterium]MBN2762101.1 elongation factor Ts [Bacteroidales bacterium]